MISTYHVTSTPFLYSTKTVLPFYTKLNNYLVKICSTFVVCLLWKRKQLYLVAIYTKEGNAIKHFNLQKTRSYKLMKRIYLKPIIN